MPSRKKPGGAGGILHIKFQPFAPPPNSHCKHRKEPPQIDANLAFDCDRRSCIWPPDPPLPQHPPRSAPPPGSAAGRAWHASGRLGRRAPSAAAQERVANPGSRAHGPGSSSSAPPGSSQHHRAHAVVAGKACGLPEGHGPALRLPPGRAPAPRSPLTSLARVPQACAAGCCCWLRLLLLLLAPTSGWGEPVAQPHHLRRVSSAYDARLGPRAFSGPERPVVGARPPPSPTSPPAPPPPSPPPTHVFGQPLRSC